MRSTMSTRRSCRQPPSALHGDARCKHVQAVPGILIDLTNIAMGGGGGRGVEGGRGRRIEGGVERGRGTLKEGGESDAVAVWAGQTLSGGPVSGWD